MVAIIIIENLFVIIAGIIVSACFFTVVLVFLAWLFDIDIYRDDD